MSEKKQKGRVLNHNKGFSLIGVMVSVFITSVSLVGILGLVNMALQEASLGKMKLIASGLAQEGIEVVRDIRKAETEWDDWYSSVTSGNYLIQYDSTSLAVFADTPLLLDSGSSLYQYSTGNNSPFYRKIILTKISANEVKILVEVKWSNRGTWRYLITEGRLWNWK